MVWENTATQFGVTIVANNRTVAILNTGNSASYTHNYEGFSRTSFTGMHIQSVGINQLAFYPFATPGAAIYTTVENFREQISYKEILWWPIANRIMVRQRDNSYWDMFGYDTYFSTNATSGPPLTTQYIENVASGRIYLQGYIPIRPVFSSNNLFAITKYTRTSTTTNVQLSALSWNKYGSTVLATWDLTAVANNITSLVSFGTSGAVL